MGHQRIGTGFIWIILLLLISVSISGCKGIQMFKAMNTPTSTPQPTATRTATATVTQTPTATFTPTITPLPLIEFGADFPVDGDYKKLPKMTEADISSGAWIASIEAKFGKNIEAPQGMMLFTWGIYEVSSTYWSGGRFSILCTEEDRQTFDAIDFPDIDSADLRVDPTDVAYPHRNLLAYTWIENYRDSGHDVLVAAFRFFNSDNTSVVIPMLMDMQRGEDQFGEDPIGMYAMITQSDNLDDADNFGENYGAYPILTLNPYGGTDGSGSTTTISGMIDYRPLLEIVAKSVEEHGVIPDEASLVPWPFDWFRY